MNAMLSDRLTLAQRKRFGVSSEKYADGYTQLNLFNEAEQEADPNVLEPDLEEVHPAFYRRKKRSGKKEEDLSSFATTEVTEYKLTGADRYCPECNTKYKVVTKETVKRLKFVPARFEVAEEVTFVYSCPKCGAMKRPEKTPSLLKGSVATPSLVAGIMNAKYVNGMPLARQEREFARYGLALSTKTMANWIIQCADRYLQPLYGLMKEELLRSNYLHGDETRIQGSMSRTRRVPRRTGCGSISRMDTAAHRRWCSSSTNGPGQDTIRRNSLEIRSVDLSPAMDTRHTTTFRRGSL